MVDRDFNSKENMPNIKISMMPDPSKLLLSTSAGESPDVALGIASYTPFDFAIRNAAYDLSSFADFYDVASRFPSGTLVPFVLNDRFYALTYNYTTSEKTQLVCFSLQTNEEISRVTV